MSTLKSQDQNFNVTFRHRALIKYIQHYLGFKHFLSHRPTSASTTLKRPAQTIIFFHFLAQKIFNMVENSLISLTYFFTSS